MTKRKSNNLNFMYCIHKVVSAFTVILCGVLISFNAFGITCRTVISSQDSMDDYRVNSAEIFANIRKSSRGLLEHGTIYLSSASIKDGSEGDLNAGVVLATDLTRQYETGSWGYDPHGKYIVKIAIADRTINVRDGQRQPPEFDKKMVDNVTIQIFLGENGLAPQILGFSPETGKPDSAFYTIIERITDQTRINISRTSPHPRAAISMEWIPNAWNLPKAKRTPQFMLNWTLEDLQTAVKRILFLQNFVDKHDIYAADAQFFLSPFKRPDQIVFGDLDEFRSKKDPKNNFGQAIATLVLWWTHLNNQSIYDKDWESLFGIKAPTSKEFANFNFYRIARKEIDLLKEGRQNSQN